MQAYLEQFPFIAIVRGIMPEEVLLYAKELFAAGFRIIEVPLNSPSPYESIKIMTRYFEDKALIGAGTVTNDSQVAKVADAGGKLIISPNCDEKVINATKRHELISVPGVATPTEAMTGLAAGADGLKLFPAEIISPEAVKALRAVLPEKVLLLPVGGINTDNWESYFEAGAAGFGLGSSLYKKGVSVDRLRENATIFKESWQRYVKKR